MTGRKEIKEGYMWASVQVHEHVNMLMRCIFILLVGLEPATFSVLS